MIKPVQTPIIPSSNAGFIGGLTCTRYKISKTKLDALIDIDNFFVVGNDILTMIDQLQSWYRDLIQQFNNPELFYNFKTGFRSNGGTTEWYQSRSDVSVDLKTAVNALYTYDATDHYFDFVLKTDGTPYIMSANSLSLVVGEIRSCIKPDTATVNKQVIVYFDEITKKITSINSGSDSDKKAVISLSYSWVGNPLNVKKFNNGVVLLAPYGDTGTYSGVGFQINDQMTRFDDWYSSGTGGYFEFKVGGVTNAVGPSVSTGQWYYAQPEDSSKPELNVQVVMDSTFYKAPEVFAKL